MKPRITHLFTRWFSPILLASLVFGGCGEIDDSDVNEPADTIQRKTLTPATMNPTIVKLNAEHRENIFWIHDIDNLNFLRCLGFAVAENAIMTSSECIRNIDTGDLNDEVGISRIVDDEIETLIVTSSVSHPKRPISVLSIKPNSATLKPFALATDPVGFHDIGSVFEGPSLADRDESNPFELEFVGVRLEDFDTLTVDFQGEGIVGFCSGDQGTPMFRNGRDGEIEVLGLLYGGDLSCKDQDVFTRTDGLKEWLVSVKVL